MASGSRPTRKRTSMDRKGKGTTTSDAAPRSRLPPIESVLNQARFFSNREQMVTYGLRFHHRVVLAPKLMDFTYFASSGLYFHHHLEFQGLKHFVAMSSSYFEDLIKVFYSNLRVSEAGYLYSEVNKTKIKMKPADWLIVAGFKYEGHKLSFTNMPEDIEYDRDTALASMIRPEMQGRNVNLLGVSNDAANHLLRRLPEGIGSTPTTSEFYPRGKIRIHGLLKTIYNHYVQSKGNKSEQGSSTKCWDMIWAIRACKTAVEERAVVRKECAAIRVAINENDQDY
ncbi:hypothetical protein Fmac_015761 [Flemingia macrophylla]|uniref:Uncharacterized protein n=1 Tax=Flemingia macrophylla TaxID=520843 RepID=A0ABD1MGC9_9FABA